MLIRRHLQPQPHHDIASPASLDGHRRALLRIVQQGHNLSLVGPAGAGKTRLLREISHASRRPAEASPLLLYLDGRDLQEVTEQQLFAIRAEAISRCGPDFASGDRPANSRLDHYTYAHLVATRDACAQRGLRVCFLLDHCEALARNPRLSTCFFSALRSLCSRPEVSLVCATRQALTGLPRLAPRRGSVLWNVFMVLRLHPQAHSSRRHGLAPMAGSSIAVPA